MLSVETTFLALKFQPQPIYHCLQVVRPGPPWEAHGPLVAHTAGPGGSASVEGRTIPSPPQLRDCPGYWQLTP